MKPPAWTQDRVDQLTALAADGLSAKQIAQKMGVTRNAIIGKVARAGIKLQGALDYKIRETRAKNRRLNAVQSERAEKAEARHAKRKVSPRQPTAKAKAKKPAPPVLPVTLIVSTKPHSDGRNRVPFIDRAAGQCGYPLWSAGASEKFVCGNPTDPGERYCPICRDVCFVTPPKDKKEPPRLKLLVPIM